MSSIARWKVVGPMLASVVFALSACAILSPPGALPLGTTIDEARHAYGGPTGQYPLPGGGTSDYALFMYVDGVRLGVYEAFCRDDTRIPLMYMPDALRALIKEKEKGHTVEAPEEPKGAEVIDLMEALKRSLGQSGRGGGHKAAPKPSAAKKPPAKRAAAKKRA